jgi:hypothetical protein
MTGNKRPTMRGHSLPFLAALLSGISATLLFGGRDVLPQAAAARASAATPAASAAGGVLYVPASAHASGANGSNWRTDVEVHNPGAGTASFTVQLLLRDADNSSPQSRSYTLGAQQARRFTDFLVSEFGAEGAAALRVTASSGLVVTSRTYNFVGQNPWSLPQGASFGQFVPGYSESEAIGYGQEGRLIQLTQQASATLDGFRTNLGIVNTTGIPIGVRIDLYKADGTYLGKKDGTETNLPPYGFRQLDQVFSAWGSVADGYAVVRTTTPGGGLFAFATVVDNHNSGDPIFVPAMRLASSGLPPTATPTPTVTPATGSSVDLAPYKPSTWENPLVPSNQKDALSTTQLVASLPTYVRWAVANNGPADIAGTIFFELRIDGVPYTRWRTDSGLKGGYYAQVENYEIPPNTLSPGAHTLTIVADPDNTIVESNETNNSWGKTWEWVSIFFVRGGSGPAATSPVQPRRTVPELELTAGSERPVEGANRGGTGAGLAGVERVAAASTPIYVPASAHASGMNGSSWRTDVEVHNPGTTGVTFTIEMLRQGNDNRVGVPVQTFSLGPQQGVRYMDILSTVFGTDGAASLRLTPQSGTILVNSRTYNLIGPNGVGLPVGASFGQFVPGLSETEAIGFGEEGRIIQLTHRDASSFADFRTNAGFVNTTGSPIDLRIDLFSASGSLLGTIQDSRTHLRAYEFLQINGIFGEFTDWLEDGYVVLRTTTPGGRFFAFATVVDNHLTGDPIFIPAVRMAGSTVPPTPTPTPTGTVPPTPTPTRTPTATATPTPPPGDVVTGPGGTSIALPTGGRTPGAAVTITTGNGAALAKTGETLVSTVIGIGVGGEGSTTGAGPFVVRIPVTGTVSDPSKLLLKVQTNVGPVYPVVGVYDSASKTFTAELQGLWNGWTMGVVTNPNLQILASAGSGVGGAGTLGWVTPDDWQTCGWGVVDDRPWPVASVTFPGEIQQALGKACDHLRSAQFRSPKLWINSNENRKARVAHIVVGSGPNDPSTSFRSSSINDEEDAAFSYVGYNDAQMQSLGQLYFNWDDFTNVVVPNGWSTGNIAIHELLHAVTHGYDIRDKWWKDGVTWNHTLMWLLEGNSTVVGMTYQTNLNGIWGGDVTVRGGKPPEKLDEFLQYPTGYRAYSRQDFFSYVAKRYNGGSFLDLRNLYQDLSDQTNGQFGKTFNEYVTLYRRAMDIHYHQAFGVTLPDLYTEFALDRAYHHTEPALLRDADRALPKNSLDKTVFSFLTPWDPGTKGVITAGDAGFTDGLLPLQTWAISAGVPAAAQTAGKLDLQFTVTGAPVSHTGVRIFVFRESNGVMVSGGDQEVTDVSKPVSVPVGATTQTLTILVVNGSVEDTRAQVTVSASVVSISISPVSTTLAPGGTQQFTAAVTGASNAGVTWSVQEGAAGGSVTAGGLYTAPGSNGTYHVKATAQADPTKSATATVTVSATPAPLFIQANISYTSWGTYRDDKGVETSGTFNISNDNGPFAPAPCRGAMTGLTFSCSLSAGGSTGQITVVLNSTYDTVLTFAFDQVVTYSYGTSTKSLAGGNVPYSSEWSDSGGSVFRLDGSSTCSHITKAVDSWTRTSAGGMGSSTLVRVSYPCTESSSLYISLDR